MKLQDITKEELTELVENSKNLSHLLDKINVKKHGGNFKTLKLYLKKYNLPIPYLGIRISKKQIQNLKRPIDLSLILVENSSYTSTNNLKHRLYKAGVKKHKCEKCGQTEIWNGEHMSLILDHINGINDDHREENLRILCPNCNATLPTHSGRNAKLFNSNKPSYKLLVSDLKSNTKKEIAVKYNVSIHTIRRWLKKYETLEINHDSL